MGFVEGLKELNFAELKILCDTGFFKKFGFFHLVFVVFYYDATVQDGHELILCKVFGTFQQSTPFLLKCQIFL